MILGGGRGGLECRSRMAWTGEIGGWRVRMAKDGCEWGGGGGAGG